MKVESVVAFRRPARLARLHPTLGAAPCLRTTFTNEVPRNPRFLPLATTVRISLKMTRCCGPARPIST